MIVRNTTHSHGTVTDQDGNTYVFNYSNEFRATLEEGVYLGLHDRRLCVGRQRTGAPE